MAAPPILSGSTIPYRIKNNGFSPRQVGSGSLQLWLDSSDINVNGVRPVEGQQLNSWNDKSGLGNNVTAGSTKPTYQAGAVNFSALSYFQTSLSDVLANETIFIVVKYSGSNNILLYPIDDYGRLLSIKNNTLVTQPNNSDINLSYGTTSTNNINLVCTVRDIYNLSHYIDGLNVGTTAVGVYSGTDVSWLGNGLTGTIYEVICYSSVLNSVERQQVESYLAWKWNIKLNTFLPNQLPNLELWLDSRDLAQNGSTVSVWPDKSGNSHSVVATTTAPTTTSTGVYFTLGAGLNTNYNLDLPAGQSPDETVFVVFQYSGIAAQQYVLYNTAVDGRNLGLSNNTLQTIATTTLTGGAISANSLILITTRTTAATPLYQQFVNGTSTASSGTIAYTGSMTIGSNTYVGYISEIIIYNTPLSDSNRQTVENYLAVKWNLNPVLSSVLPTSISGLRIWLDATDVNGDGTVYTNNTQVSTWVNKSSSGITVTQPTSSNRPTYSNNAIVFNGSNGFNTTYTTLSTETVFAVLTVTSMSGTMNILQATLAGNRSLSIDNYKLVTKRTAGQLSNGNISVSNITLITTLNNNTNMFHYINGNSNSGVTSGTTSNTGTTIIGIDSGFTGGFVGNINELIIYNTALSDTDRRNMETYLTKKWIPSPSNLPISHPYYYNNISANTPYILSPLPRNINGSNTFNSNNYPLISNKFRTTLGLTFKSFP